MQSRENGHNNIWLIAGTGEGHRLANLLVDQGWQVTVSVVNDSASLPYQEISLKSIRIGPLQGVEGIKGVVVTLKTCICPGQSCIAAAIALPRGSLSIHSSHLQGVSAPTLCAQTCAALL